ncbi:MAG: hypothetical protein ABFD96_15035 [Armatimonadia bacterium]
MRDQERALRLAHLELVATGLGAAMGLVAAAPLVWLTVEAQRTGNFGLSRTATFYLWELGALWLGGALTGGWLAALLSRALLREPLGAGAADCPAGGGQPVPLARRLLHLVLGTIIIIILAPAPAALVLAFAYRQVAALVDFYLIGGGLIGWQSGVIAFVFLYTFEALERRRERSFVADCAPQDDTG